jgi:hypothetical protein
MPRSHTVGGRGVVSEIWKCWNKQKMGKLWMSKSFYSFLTDIRSIRRRTYHKFCITSRSETVGTNTGRILQCSVAKVSPVCYRSLSAAGTLCRSSGRRLWVRTPIMILVVYALKIAWHRKNTHLWPLCKKNPAIRTISLEIPRLQSSNLPDPEFLIIIISITDHSDRMR